MVTIREQTKEILGRADEQIRRLIAAAATAGDLDGVDTAREIAGRIREILRILEGNQNTVIPPQRVPKNAASVIHRKRKSAYPKYYLRNDALCRLGWSKKQKEEYVHKAPKPVFDKTITTLTALSKTGSGPFAAERIIAEINRAATTLIPSYQIYVVIGFLREHQCIGQTGREGYHVPSDFSTKASTAWRNNSKSDDGIGG